jgi:alpha-galactosidase
VHADYAYWTKDMTEENVAKFMAGMVFYGVPTISIDLETLPKSHFAIAKVWLDFYRSHLQRFMTGQLDHLSDDFHYSTARVSSDGVTYIPCFLRQWPSVLTVLPEHTHEVYLANMTSRPQLFTRVEGATGTYRVTLTDLMLKPTGKETTVKGKNGIIDINLSVAIGGVAVLKRV